MPTGELFPAAGVGSLRTGKVREPLGGTPAVLLAAGRRFGADGARGWIAESGSIAPGRTSGLVESSAAVLASGFLEICPGLE